MSSRLSLTALLTIVIVAMVLALIEDRLRSEFFLWLTRFKTASAHPELYLIAEVVVLPLKSKLLAESMLEFTPLLILTDY